MSCYFQAKYGTGRVAKPIAAQAKAARVAGTGATPVPTPTRHIQTGMWDLFLTLY
jgi:hypothetical protein